MMRRTLIIAVALMLSACGSGGPMPETAAVAAEPTQQPLPQPAPAPPADPIPGPAPAPMPDPGPAPQPDPVPPAPEPVDPPPPAPITVIIVGSSAAETLKEGPGACCFDVVTPLREAGFLLETIDAPCHGNDQCIVGGLEGYAAEVAAGNTEWRERFCRRLRDKIDGRPVFVAGISRGGYAVLSCELEAPVRGVIGYAPVTDLFQLDEFADVTPTNAYDLMGQRIPALIRIGKMDERVGTEAAVEYAQSTGADLHLLDTPGHTAPEMGDGVEWIRAHL